MTEISEASKRAAYKKVVTDLKPKLIEALTKDNRYNKKDLEKILDSEIGEGILCSVLGAGFRTTKIKGHEDIQEALSKEMSTLAYDKVGGLVAELASGPITAALFSLLNNPDFKK